MVAVTQFCSTHDTARGATAFTNPTNVSAEAGGVATSASIGRRTTGNEWWLLPAFTIPVGATIDSVVTEVRWRVTAANGSAVTYRLDVGATAKAGSYTKANTAADPTVLTTVQFTSTGVTRDELVGINLAVFSQWVPDDAAAVVEIDFIRTTVNYTVASTDFTGAAAFTGSGSLAATSRLTAQAAAALTGAGALTVTPRPAVTGPAGLTGSGALTASGVAATPQAEAGSASLTGSGSLAGPVAPAAAAAVGLTGSGALAAAGRPATAGAVALTGSGTLTGPTSSAVPAVAVLSGSGTLVAAAAPDVPVPAAFTGSGSLTAVAQLAPPTSLTVTPDGSGLRLDWTASVSPQVTGYMIRRLVGATPPSGPTDGVLVAQV